MWQISSSNAAEPTYWQDVWPVFRKHCTVCHSAKKLNEPEVSGGLALDGFDSFRKGPKAFVVRPGKSADSRLVKLLLEMDEDKRMPQGGKPLPEETVALIRRWIDAGAPEGKKPANLTEEASRPAQARIRRRDVVMATTAVPPRGVLGPANPGRLELAVKVGPLNPVAAVAFSPDGRFLAAGSYGQVAVWDLKLGRPVKVLTAVLGAVNDVRFSPDGKVLAVAGGQPSAKGDLRLFRCGDWKLLATLGGHEDVVSSVTFHPDGNRLISASFDKTVRVWDLGTLKPERSLAGHSDFVYAVANGPGGRWLATASKDRTVKLVDAATGKSRYTLSGMNEDVLAVAVSPEGNQVVSSGYESGLYWWDAQTGKRIRVQGGHGAAVHELGFSKDGRVLFSCSADQSVRLWNGSTGAPMRTLSAGSIVYAAALSLDSKLVAGGAFDGLVRLWDAATGRLLVLLLAVPGKGDTPDWLAVTPEGYATGSKDLTMEGRWQMAGRPVAGESVWKVLRKPEMVARALRRESLAPPRFEK